MLFKLTFKVGHVAEPLRTRVYGKDAGDAERKIRAWYQGVVRIAKVEYYELGEWKRETATD